MEDSKGEVKSGWRRANNLGVGQKVARGKRYPSRHKEGGCFVAEGKCFQCSFQSHKPVPTYKTPLYHQLIPSIMAIDMLEANWIPKGYFHEY